MSIFHREKAGKVPFSNATISKCICSRCPVQAESTCAIGKEKKLNEMMNINPIIPSASEPVEPMGGEMMLQANPTNQKEVAIKPEEVPGTYCSIGTATCSDLNMNKSCICGQCQVYAQYTLSGSRPVEHFCFNGRAQ